MKIKNLTPQAVIIGIVGMISFVEAAEGNAESRSNALTADDQKLTKFDAEIVAKIRRVISKNDNLSFNAKNVKIISRGGNINLAGKVEKLWEKDWIEQQVKKTAGIASVKNDLTVESN